MAVFDIILIVIMVYAIIQGLMKGFVMSMASLLGIFVSLYVTKNYGPMMMDFILSKVGWTAEVNVAVSYVIVFFVMMILVRYAAILVNKLVKFAMLGWLDKLLGGVFSWVKCLVILSFLLYSFGKINGYFHFVSDEYLSQTMLYEPIRSIAFLFFKGESMDV